jgi:hypothetical protein
MTRAGGVMSELADGTGGAFFHNNNDLAAGFKSLTDAPEVVYVLELSLDGVFLIAEALIERHGTRNSASV